MQSCVATLMLSIIFEAILLKIRIAENYNRLFVSTYKQQLIVSPLGKFFALGVEVENNNDSFHILKPIRKPRV